VALVHAPALEKKYVSEGKLQNRRLVMYNDFVVVGPAEDPARIKGLPKAAEAMKRIAESQSRFVSRGDKSGTNLLELALWTQAGVEPRGAWYIESGRAWARPSGSPMTGARTPSPTGHVPRVPEARGPADPGREGPAAPEHLLRDGGEPCQWPRVNVAGGKAFADFMLSPETQGAIRTFGVDRYGQPLFIPIAGKRDEDFP